MTFQFGRHGLTGFERRLERALQMLPGMMSWTLLLGMIWLSWSRPILAALVVIAFDLYWLLRLWYISLFLALSYGRLAAERRADWMARIRDVEAAVTHGTTPARPASLRGFHERLAFRSHEQGVRAIIESGQRPPAAAAIRHLVIIPIARELPDVYEPGIVSLTQQQFPLQQIMVILAVEARASSAVQAGADDVQRRFRPRFLDVLVVRHPDGLPGEARVKGANATYAAKAAAAYFTERGITHDRVVVSCFDADTVVSPNYFACLTYQYLLCPQRARASFQPIPTYHNNIWEVPGFARVLDVGASFFQLVEATNPERLVTFSSHSMSFQALVEIGYWPVDLISDDSAIFWKALIHYDGDYRVVPMYVTVSMDVAASRSWRQTIVNVYRQKRRWAWGVENFPIVMRAFLRAQRIARRRRLAYAFKLLEGHVSWATWPMLLAVIGWLPALFAGREFSSTVVYYSAPRITMMIFRLASFGLLTTILVSWYLLPRAPARPWLRKLAHGVEWLFVPATAIFLSAIPALDAQTRLMCGRYLEFWVTEKTRNHPPLAAPKAPHS